jgi:hypothetical protein
MAGGRSSQRLRGKTRERFNRLPQDEILASLRGERRELQQSTSASASTESTNQPAETWLARAQRIALSAPDPEPEGNEDFHLPKMRQSIRAKDLYQRGRGLADGRHVQIHEFSGAPHGFLK